MKILCSVLATLALAGCGGTVRLLEEGHVHMGKYDAMNKSLNVSVDGVEYTGNYVLNSSASYGGIFAGARYIPINSYSSANMGRAILTSTTGKIVRCEFMVQGMNAQGACTDNNGKRYDMIAGQ